MKLRALFIAAGLAWLPATLLATTDLAGNALANAPYTSGPTYVLAHATFDAAGNLLPAVPFTAGQTYILTFPATLTTNLANQSILLGANGTFVIGAAGTPPFGYQWFSNGVPVAGSTGSQFAIAGTSTLNTNAQYQVVVTNAGGSTTSVLVKLTLYVPKITAITQATNRLITLYCQGLPNAATRMRETTNLLTPLAQWNVIFTNYTTTTDGLWQVVETIDTNYTPPYRFYNFTTP